MSSTDVKLNFLREIDNLPEQALKEIDELLQKYAAKPTDTAKKQRQFGSMKGLVIYMAPDFDAPLDDFKDYM